MSFLDHFGLGRLSADPLLPTTASTPPDFRPFRRRDGRTAETEFRTFAEQQAQVEPREPASPLPAPGPSSPLPPGMAAGRTSDPVRLSPSQAESTAAAIIRAGQIRRGEVEQETLPTNPLARAIVLAARKRDGR